MMVVQYHFGHFVVLTRQHGYQDVIELHEIDPLVWDKMNPMSKTKCVISTWIRPYEAVTADVASVYASYRKLAEKFERFWPLHILCAEWPEHLRRVEAHHEDHKT